MTVLLGGALVPVLLMTMMLLGVRQQRPRRFFWLIPLLISNLLFATAYASQQRWDGAGTLWWTGAAFVMLLGGVITWVLTPRSQR